MATDMATDLGGRYCGALETKSVSASVSVRVMCLCVPFLHMRALHKWHVHTTPACALPISVEKLR